MINDGCWHDQNLPRFTFCKLFSNPLLLVLLEIDFLDLMLAYLPLVLTFLLIKTLIFSLASVQKLVTIILIVLRKFLESFNICASQVQISKSKLNLFLVSFYLMYVYKYVFDMQTKKFPLANTDAAVNFSYSSALLA